MKKKNKVDKALSILNKDSKIFQNMIIALMAMLILAIIVGLLHEKRRRKKARMREFFSRFTEVSMTVLNIKVEVTVSSICFTRGKLIRNRIFYNVLKNVSNS